VDNSQPETSDASIKTCDVAPKSIPEDPTFNDTSSPWPQDWTKMRYSAADIGILVGSLIRRQKEYPSREDSTNTDQDLQGGDSDSESSGSQSRLLMSPMEMQLVSIAHATYVQEVGSTELEQTHASQLLRYLQAIPVEEIRVFHQSRRRVDRWNSPEEPICECMHCCAVRRHGTLADKTCVGFSSSHFYTARVAAQLRLGMPPGSRFRDSDDVVIAKEFHRLLPHAIRDLHMILSGNMPVWKSGVAQHLVERYACMSKSMSTRIQEGWSLGCPPWADETIRAMDKWRDWEVDLETDRTMMRMASSIEGEELREAVRATIWFQLSREDWWFQPQEEGHKVK
jgi:hypothetical protein